MISRAQPAVSVLITVYNGEDTLPKAIDSILHQTLENLELIVIDDGSDDATPAILRQVQSDPRAHIITLPRTMHRAKMLNMALRHSHGRYVAILDADDIADLARLEIQYNYLEAHPELGLLGTGCKIVAADGGHYLRDSIPPLTDQQIRRELFRSNPIRHSTIMVPRRVMNVIGGYNERYQISEDYELYFRVAHKYQIGAIPDTLVLKRTGGYFDREITSWRRQLLNMKIRWHGCRLLSCPFGELRFVFGDPLMKIAYNYFHQLSDAINVRIHGSPAKIDAS